MLISNIKLAILNMHQYVIRRAISLAGDKKEEGDEEKAVAEQLSAIIAHIEDLEMVNARGRDSDLSAGYMEPLASDKSELRLDY